MKPTALDITELEPKYSTTVVSLHPISYIYKQRLSNGTAFDATGPHGIYDYSIAFAQYGDKLAEIFAYTGTGIPRDKLHHLSDFTKAIVEINYEDITEKTANRLIKETSANIAELCEKIELQKQINEINGL